MMGIELLNKMKEHGLFAHALTEGETLPGIPLAVLAISTHYLMEGSEIVFVGSAQGVINFVENNYK